MRTCLLAVTITLAWAGCTCSSEVTIAPPRVNQGGRAVAISVSQSDAKRILVASESGGLFRTFDGGVSFQHLDAFPTFRAVDVAIASLDPNVMIATARDDFRATSGGGIWRSADGGATWKRPVGWPPTNATCSSGRPGAGGISHIPLTRTFHVATDCGLAISNDNGATFTTTALDPFNPALFSVLVTGRTTGVAADSKRVWFLQNGGWTPSLGGPDAGGTFTPHAFASPFWADPNIFYHAGRDQFLWFSTTAGGAWRQMPTPAHGPNREPFVRVGRGLDGDDSHLDVYYGDGFTLLRQAVTVLIPGGNNTWKGPDHMDHRDPADLAFTPGFTQPLMLATDGGVHLTPDNGKNWILTGSNFGGFTALQIVEMAGRTVGGNTPHLDLYYSTQDNDIKASSDGGHTWDGSICCEGAFLRADGANPAHVDAPVTGRVCDNCRYFIVPPHVGQQSNPPLFASAPMGASTGPIGPPFQLIGNSYLQEVANTAVPAFDYFLTPDKGTSWAPAFTLPRARIGIAQFAGNLDNPVTYVGVTNFFGAGLFRASGVTGQVSVRRADSTGILALGVMSTGQAQYTVFGVDPANPDHLFAPDLAFMQMRASPDGGLSWFDLPAMTTAVSDTGRFLLTNSQQPFVTTIAWDPTNSCHILVGTMQNGVIRSADGGLTWKRVTGSPVATWVTSFHFPPTGPIWMSTYGRGLWTLSVDRKPPPSGRCLFPRPPGITLGDTLVILARNGAPPRSFGGLADTLVCATCSVVSVEGGFITDVAGDSAIDSVAMSSGVMVQHARDGRELPSGIANRYLESETPALIRLVGAERLQTRKVRALVVDGTRLVAFVMGLNQAIGPPTRLPTIYVQSADSLGVFDVSGYQFLPGTGPTGVTMTFDADTVARGVKVEKDGRFTLRVRSMHGPGPVTVRAVQRDGRRTTVVRESYLVPGRDRQ